MHTGDGLSGEVGQNQTVDYRACQDDPQLWFFIYVVQSYMGLNPYIKGLYLRVDSWHPERAEDGFKWMSKNRHQCSSTKWRREDNRAKESSRMMRFGE